MSLCVNEKSATTTMYDVLIWDFVAIATEGCRTFSVLYFRRHESSSHLPLYVSSFLF
jgi:hypothetical protein